MLALHWPSGPRPLDPLPFGHWSRRTPVTIGIGRYRLSSLLARDGARNHSINRTVQRSTKPPVPEFFVRLARWAASLGSRTSYARWDNGHKGNSPENGTCRTMAVVNLRQGSKWLVNGSLVPEPRYADNSQSVSQKAEFSGWLKRKTGRVCRTKVFAASQSKNRLPHAVRGRGCRTV